MAKKDLREENARRNRFAREGRPFIGSPYRTQEYVEHRMKGKTHEQALELVKSVDNWWAVDRDP